MEYTGIILCVDDEVAVLETLSQQLEKKFGSTHRIETASSGEEALEIVRSLNEQGEIIEVVITDQVMPGLKGDKLLHEIHSFLPDTIKILLTGQAGLSSAISAINYGGLNRYYEKPWDIDQMAKDIENLIERFQAHIENQHLISRLEQRIRELEKT